MLISNHMNRNGQLIESYNNGFLLSNRESMCCDERNLKTKSCEYIVIYQDELYSLWSLKLATLFSTLVDW